MFKTALAAMISAVLLTGAASANPGWVTEDLNFRHGPGTRYGVIAALPYCTRIHVYEHYNGWYRATWRGIEGWVSARFVAGSDDFCYAPPPPPKRHHPRGNSYHYNYYFYGH